MTTLLPAYEVDALRSLKATAFLLAVMIRLDHYHPGLGFRAEQIAPIVEMDVRTVEKHLASLSARNRVILTGAGYVLTEGGRAMFLPGGPTPALPDKEINEALAQSPDYQTQAQEDQARSTPVSAETPATHSVCVLREEDSVNLILDIDSPPSESSGAQNAQQGMCSRDILDKTGMLFDKPVLLPQGIDQITPALALGWVAHGYDQRQTRDNPNGLYAPWGLIYKRLCEGKQPRADYLVSPAQYLPRAYLEAVGYPLEDAPENEADQDTGRRRYTQSAFEEWLG